MKTSKWIIAEGVNNVVWTRCKQNTFPIGYDIGKQIIIRIRTSHTKFAPTASPYLVHIACGITCHNKEL